MLGEHCMRVMCYKYEWFVYSNCIKWFLHSLLTLSPSFESHIKIVVIIVKHKHGLCAANPALKTTTQIHSKELIDES